MSFLNINYGLISYKDPSPTNPKVRLGGDVSKSYQGIQTQNHRTLELTVSPGETKEVFTTLRAVGVDATTQFEFVRAYDTESNIRLRWTGVGSAPNFRTKRSLGIDATTQISTTRIAPNAVRIQRVAGTSMNTAGVQVGDFLKLERTADSFTSPFNNNQAEWQIQSKGSDYVDIVDNQTFVLETSPITLGTDFDFAFRIISQSAVKANDTIEIDGTTVNPSNKGSFQVVSVSSDYVEITNSYGVEETFTNSSNQIKIYDHLMGFVHFISNSAFLMKVNDREAFEVGLLTPSDAVFLGSVKAYKIEVTNETNRAISIDAQFSSVG